MSFILDALKKSESERQRQLAPGLIDPGIAAPRKVLPVWAVVLLISLGISVIGLCFALLRHDAPQRTAGQTASLAAEPLKRAAPALRPAARQQNGGEASGAFSPMDNTPQYAPEIPLAETPAVQPGAATAGGSQAPARQLAQSAGPAAVPPTASSMSPSEQDEPLPTIGEIDFGGAGSPPELHLDVHVYAANPSERFVFINGRKYVEGSVLQDGLRIESIRRDGVALNFRGKRFLLPRQ